MTMQSHVCRGIPYFNNRAASAIDEHRSHQHMQISNKTFGIFREVGVQRKYTTFLRTVLC
jgi:hypothetical protein